MVESGSSIAGDFYYGSMELKMVNVIEVQPVEAGCNVGWLQSNTAYRGLA